MNNQWKTSAKHVWEKNIVKTLKICPKWSPRRSQNPIENNEKSCQKIRSDQKLYYFCILCFKNDFPYQKSDVLMDSCFQPHEAIHAVV